MHVNLRCALVITVLFCPSVATAQWSTVGDGIEYREYTISGPNNLFVSRLARANTNAFIESTIGQGRVSGGTETVRNQAGRYDDAINYWDQVWGQRNDAVVAINGSYYNTSTGVPTSGMIHSGWYAKRYDNLTWESGFVWQLDRDAFIGECVTHLASKQIVTYVASGNTQTFQGINRSRGSGELIIYTPQYDSDTKTDNTGAEVLVELERPMYLIPSPSRVTGYVRQIRQNQGSTPIPFDHVVLSATGSAATTLLNNVSLGAPIGISQEIRSFTGGTCSQVGTLDWTKSYAAVSGNWVYLENGVIQYGIDSSGLRHPRTAIALNNDHIFFIVCDGRSGISIGMTIDELAEFTKFTLGATWGVNQDGGGSSTMVVNGVVKNVPSDGSERAVSNGLMMVNIQPKIQSSAFGIGNAVRATTNAGMFLGPGTNYVSFTTLATNQQGTILGHTLKGVYAKSKYWWKCDFGGTRGWVAEDQLALVSGGTPPTITLHPSDKNVILGGSTTFTVQATSQYPVTGYQWQKNQANITNGGAYSGALTNTLAVSGATQSEAGNYRCVVSNQYGGTPSNEAVLSIVSPDFDNDTDVDLVDFAHLQLCLGTPIYATVLGCTNADLNGDLAVDFSDVQDFRNAMSGSRVPAAPGYPVSP
ncbi:MAG TPA: phosphodiester glycosidase family protein [Phycisphaerae bacterium]|nr:phosphodiester glycosidase family protein [Phycisphaerae bacterium]